MNLSGPYLPHLKNSDNNGNSNNYHSQDDNVKLQLIQPMMPCVLASMY